MAGRGAGAGAHGDKDEYVFKLVLIGNAGVGKTCLLTRFAVRPSLSPGHPCPPERCTLCATRDHAARTVTPAPLCHICFSVGLTAYSLYVAFMSAPCNRTRTSSPQLPVWEWTSYVSAALHNYTTPFSPPFPNTSPWVAFTPRCFWTHPRPQHPYSRVALVCVCTLLC